jgi:hypothetical protein
MSRRAADTGDLLTFHMVVIHGFTNVVSLFKVVDALLDYLIGKSGKLLQNPLEFLPR